MPTIRFSALLVACSLLGFRFVFRFALGSKNPVKGEIKMLKWLVFVNKKQKRVFVSSPPHSLYLSFTLAPGLPSMERVGGCLFL